RLCAVWLSMRAEQRPEVRSKILQAIAEAPIAATADTPSTETQAAKQSSAPAATATQKVVYWAAAPDAELADMAHEVLSNYHAQRRDLFGRIGLAESEWKALAAYYAPRWAIHTAGPQDRLGRPVLRNGHTAIDHETPVVHYQVGYARAGGQTLVQIQYFAWFGGDDPNHFGGLVWRVTLDANGQPLVYDSIGMRGREHLWFPVHSLEIATGAHPTIPQAPISAGTPQLWLQSQSHRVRQVDAVQGGARPDAGHYALRRYERLFTLEAGADDTQSLFDPTGRVRGTGVQGAGLYHLSRLSLAPGEPWYFDDPDLLRHNFVLPASAVKASGHDQPERHTTN
ncbi:MAG: hypothetical protein L0H83_15105, partial [Salinisphaera sp.]|nr:hypothetical protein [Salinisphaera sp.]